MKTVAWRKSLSASAVIFLLLASAAQAAQSSGGAQAAKATFAGGCFWCMEPPYDELGGVISTISGYIGGTKKNPSYEEVVTGTTGHTEAVQVTYDPAKISYEKLLEIFWRNIDPLTANAQFCDHGSQYRSGIFYHDEAQKKLAEASRKRVQSRFKQPVATEIVRATEFYPAEDYHQDYYKKNPVRYKKYQSGSGREGFLKSTKLKCRH